MRFPISDLLLFLTYDGLSLKTHIFKTQKIRKLVVSQKIAVFANNKMGSLRILRDT